MKFVVLGDPVDHGGPDELLIAALQAAGITCGLRHAANSAAIIDLPDSHLDAVRPGISLYGLYPSA